MAVAETTASNAITIRATDSGIVLSANTVQLEAEGSRIGLGEIDHLRGFSATNSSVELDLSMLRHDPVVKLLGSTSAEISLPTPCIVQLQKQPATFDQHIQINGCEVRVPGQPALGVRHHLQYPGGVRILRIEADSNATINVQGRL